MFKSRTLRVLIIVGVVLDLAAVGLVVGMHERGAAQARSGKRAEINDRYDAGVNVVQKAIFAWSEAHGGAWPPSEAVSQKGLSSYLGAGTSWPVNPLDGRPMRQGVGPGEYRYTPVEEKAQGVFGAYTLTGTFPSGKPYNVVFAGAPGPMRVHPTPGTIMVDGLITASGGGQTDGGPNLLLGISLQGLIRDHGVVKHGAVEFAVNDATRMFDASGNEVARVDQFSYEGKVGWWRVVARKTSRGWIALRMQPLATWADPTRL